MVSVSAKKGKGPPGPPGKKGKKGKKGKGKCRLPPPAELEAALAGVLFAIEAAPVCSIAAGICAKVATAISECDDDQINNECICELVDQLDDSFDEGVCAQELLKMSSSYGRFPHYGVIVGHVIVINNEVPPFDRFDD